MTDFMRLENRLLTGPQTDDEPFDEYAPDPDEAYDRARDDELMDALTDIGRALDPKSWGLMAKKQAE